MNSDRLPLVSVALNSFNRKKWLVECVESILAQDYPNMEIVVADCSTDGSQDVLREYEKKYPDRFVLCLSDKDLGIAGTFNLAFSNCKGKYIAQFDEDNLMLPGKISKQVAFMEKNPDCVICYHNMELFDSDTGNLLGLSNDKRSNMDGDVKRVLRYGGISMPSTMFRMDSIPKNGFNLTLPIAPDWLFTIETLVGGGTVNYIDEVLVRYRRHANNASMPSEHIDQLALDVLNTCNIMIAKYPHFFNEAIDIYARRLYKIRNKKGVPYRSALISSLRLRFRLPVFSRLVRHLLSFGLIRS